VNAAVQIDPAFETTGRARKRCAVVECYNRHDEVYLTTVHLLQQLGYEVEVFNTWRNRLKNSFVHAPGLKPRVRSHLGKTQVLDAVRRQRFDLVVMNTFEGQEVLDCANVLLLDTPVLGFMHNGSFIAGRPEYQPFVSHPRCHFMALAPYVADHFSQLAPAGTMVPVFFFDHEVPRIARTEGRRRFCVQGYFDPTRRDYGQLLGALQTLRAEGREDFEVYVMGRTLGRDFRDFEDQVKQAGLEDHLRYTWKGIGYRNYYRLLNSVDFLLPLITPDSHPTYFQSKSTSSIAAAVGFNAVPIAHQQLARFYALDDAAFTYDTDLLPAIRRALDTSEEQLAAIRAKLEAIKQRYLKDSLRQLEQAIARASGGMRSVPSGAAGPH
jgi:glycosyltransferase involved in cell wall biosynthesis